MSDQKTRSNLRMNDYNSHFSRKKVFIPAVPPGMPASVRSVGRAGAGDTTTTVFLFAVGDQVVANADMNNTHVVMPRLSTSGDEVCTWWQAPDDYYSGDAIHAWVLFANDGPTTTTVRVPYTMVYSTKKVVDYAAGSPNVTGEAIAEAASALSTAVSETVKMDGLVQYATYRGERGTINQAIIDRGDIVTLKIECGTTVSSGTMSIVGVEIDYAMRMRNETVIELYDV